MNVGGHETGDEDNPARLEPTTNKREREVGRMEARPLRRGGELDRSAVELSQVLADGHQALWGAFVLGHHQHLVRVWQIVAYFAPYGASVWEEIPQTLRELRQAIAAVAGRLSGGHVALFGALAEQIEALNVAIRPEALAKFHSNDSEIPCFQSLPGLEAWKELAILIDGMFSSDDSLRLWFEFGSAIGDCDLALNERGRLPDLAGLIRIARKAEELGVFEIPMVRQLSKIASDADIHSTAAQIIQIAVADRDCTGLFGVDLNMAIDKLYLSVTKALETGRGVSAALQSDSKNRERDRWIYDQIQAGGGERTYGAILRELDAMASQSGWEPIYSVGGLKAAARRFAKRCRLPAPIKRKRGRPRKSK